MTAADRLRDVLRDLERAAAIIEGRGTDTSRLGAVEVCVRGALATARDACEALVAEGFTPVAPKGKAKR